MPRYQIQYQGRTPAPLNIDDALSDSNMVTHLLEFLFKGSVTVEGLAQRNKIMRLLNQLHLDFTIDDGKTFQLGNERGQLALNGLPPMLALPAPNSVHIEEIPNKRTRQRRATLPVIKSTPKLVVKPKSARRMSSSDVQPPTKKRKVFKYNKDEDYDFARFDKGSGKWFCGVVQCCYSHDDRWVVGRHYGGHKRWGNNGGMERCMGKPEIGHRPSCPLLAKKPKD